MKLRDRLPSANALFVFEAVARNLSFTKAAADLNVTQPAISRSIANLEAHLSVSLFDRSRRTLRLTEDGEILWRTVEHAFGSIGQALDTVSDRARHDNRVTLSVSTSFVSHWLIPKMEAFRAALPDVDLHYQLLAGEPSGPIEPCDLGVRLETNIRADEPRWPLSPEWAFMVASPDYVRRHGRLDEVSSDSSHTLVLLPTARVAFEDFATRTGLILPTDINVINVPDYSVVMQTALNGGGVALGFVSTMASLIADGLLVPVAPHNLRTGRHYCLTVPTGQPLGRSGVAVRDWIIDAFTRDMARMTKVLEGFGITKSDPAIDYLTS